jgi:outer membrane lipoprotein
VVIRSCCSLTIVVSCLFVFFITAGCAPPFSKETLDKVNRNVSFQELKKEPEQFKGTWVMLGGMIVGSKNAKEGTLIEILQRPLDTDGRPLQTDSTEGRFLIQSDTFLDPAVYHEGRLITVVAEVIGRKELPLDDIMYTYPLLSVKDLHLWEPSQGPRFFFGIGIEHRL